MELFFNLMWGLLALALLFLWLTGSKALAKNSCLPAIPAQFVALCMLILILLPVVSLTDDMQAMTTPAEAEHISRRVSILPVSDLPGDMPWLLAARLVLSPYMPHLQTFALLESSAQRTLLRTGCIRQTANRPPPFWA